MSDPDRIREYPVPLLFPDLNDEADWIKGGTWDLLPLSDEESYTDALLIGLGVAAGTEKEQEQAVRAWAKLRSARAAPAELVRDLMARGWLDADPRKVVVMPPVDG